MAKKRKPATQLAARRSARRGKQATIEEVALVGETSTTVEATTSNTQPKSPETSSAKVEQSSTSLAQLSQSHNWNPTVKICPPVGLHKKFGKYRCLFNNDENSSRKSDVCSDSETNSSDIKIVDLCGSSESDSNAAIEIHSDTNSSASPSPLSILSNPQQNHMNIPLPASSQSSEVSVGNEAPVGSEVTVLNETPVVHEVPVIYEVPIVNEIPEVNDTPVVNETLEVNYNSMDNIENNVLQIPLPTDVSVIANDDQPVSNKDNEKEVQEKNIPSAEQIEYACDDEEIITVVQIVEDDNQELYYDIKIDSPKNEATKQTNEDEECKNYDSDFQKHFENLNLAAESRSTAHSPMDCSELEYIQMSHCNTPDIFSKENSYDLTRPDPSLTPSSILSDESNSSRVTEQTQNNSNDSAESSPTGVRRSNRIKTISNLKQKTKGYGLVKPLKKALITQTKLKLEELGSDSQEKIGETISNVIPHSSQFPIPSEMPVKVKSRWRRSSELEMGTNSPAVSPLASPGLPQRVLPLTEEQIPTDVEQAVVALTKEAYDKIIEERMNQFQHLDENEYLCDRMISRDTRKMICDCFMTKEELERGELACGEDCLNRLLMIEW